MKCKIYTVAYLAIVCCAGFANSQAPWEHCDTNNHVACINAESQQVQEIRQAMTSADHFYENNVARRRPAVLRGAVGTAPAIQSWTDSHLANEYGTAELKLQEKNEKIAADELSGSVGLGRETMAAFLDGADESAYVVSQLPTTMYGDLHIPSVASAGPLRDSMLEANIWMSNGGTSSLLHRDGKNVFNCVVKGVKHWVLVDPIAASQLPMSTEKRSEVGGFIIGDPRNVSSRVREGLAGHEVLIASVHAGDCIFVPWGFLHQVTTPDLGSRSIAYSMLFPVVHRSQCTGGNTSLVEPQESSDGTSTSTQIPGGVALQEQPPAQEYSGTGPMSMGSADPNSLIHNVQLYLSKKPKCPQIESVPSERGNCGFRSMQEVLQDAESRAKFALSDSTKQYIKSEWENVGFTDAEAASPRNGCAPVEEVATYLFEFAMNSYEAEPLKEDRQQLANAATNWVHACDMNKDGRISVAELVSSKSRQTKSMLLPLLGYDPTNQPTYELYKIKAVAVESAIERATSKRGRSTQHVRCNDLVEEYEAIGGTAAFGRALCTYLLSKERQLVETVSQCQAAAASAIKGDKADQPEVSVPADTNLDVSVTKQDIPMDKLAAELGVPAEGYDRFKIDYRRACEQWESSQTDSKSTTYKVSPPPGYYPKTEAGKRVFEELLAAKQAEEGADRISCVRADSMVPIIATFDKIKLAIGEYERRQIRVDPAMHDAEKLA